MYSIADSLEGLKLFFACMFALRDATDSVFNGQLFLVFCLICMMEYAIYVT